MSNLNKSHRVMREFCADSNLQWERVIAISVTSNAYPLDLKIKIMSALCDHNHSLLMEIAGELSAQVYTDHEEHYLMHQLSALIRKYPNASLPDVNPEDNALQVFLDGEERCKVINDRILLLRSNVASADPSGPHMHRIRRYIERVLARVSIPSEDGMAFEPDYPRIMSECRFTGGASLGVHGNATNILRKLLSGAEEGWTCTPGALPYFTAALWDNPTIRHLILSEGPGKMVCYDVHEFVARVHKSVRLVDHNKIAFAVKTALTRRIVGTEPSGCGYVQKGIDNVLRDALRYEGLDLTDQGVNRRMAYVGSRDWESSDPYCTIDLSNASGCLSYRLVEESLSPEWFSLIDAVRCRYYQLPSGVFGKYECFGSMGNGTVFPLQTLMFAAIINSVLEELDIAPDFRVYGDDIIVRKSVFSRVVEVLRIFGFEPNVKKTFGNGPFRESCGGDYHSGVNVRPVYLTGELSSLESIMRFHNQSLRREPWVKHYFRCVRRYLFNEVPTAIRCVCDHDPELPLPEGLKFGKRVTFDSAFWVETDVVMSSPLCTFNRYTHSWGYTLLSLEAVQDCVGSDINEELVASAALLTALSGGSSSKPFTLRYSSRARLVRENYPGPGKDLLQIMNSRRGRVSLMTN